MTRAPHALTRVLLWSAHLLAAGCLAPAHFAAEANDSPAVWAPKKLGPPAEAKPYTEKIAGTDVTFAMVPIPGGTFRMGSPESEAGRGEDEEPQVEVKVEPFFMGQFEVTWAEYDLFREQFFNAVARQGHNDVPVEKLADAVTYPTPMYTLAVDPILERMGGRGPRYPAVSASHFAARQYTKWLSRKTGRFYRLATEAEWEYACRAGTTTAYHFGDDATKLGEYAWTFDNSAAKDGEPAYRPVGLKKPNPWALYDMHGNVGEWVIDAHDPKHYAELLERSPVRAEQALNWPAKRYPRVIRGGGYESEADDCRSAARFASSAKLNLYDANLPKSPHWEANAFWVGFRVVCPAREPPEDEQRRYWDEQAKDVLKVLKRLEHRDVREIVPPYP